MNFYLNCGYRLLGFRIVRRRGLKKTPNPRSGTPTEVASPNNQARPDKLAAYILECCQVSVLDRCGGVAIPNLSGIGVSKCKRLPGSLPIQIRMDKALAYMLMLFQIN